MSREEHNTVGYVVALVSEFVSRYDIMPRQAYTYLSRFKGYTPRETLDILYTSENFDRLQDTKTNFYFQSVGYVASFLKNEVEKAVFC